MLERFELTLNLVISPQLFRYNIMPKILERPLLTYVCITYKWEPLQTLSSYRRVYNAYYRNARRFLSILTWKELTFVVASG